MVEIDGTDDDSTREVTESVADSGSDDGPDLRLDEMETVFKECLFRLSPEDTDDIQHRMLMADEARERIEARMVELRAQLKVEKNRITQGLQDLRDGTQTRTVECEVVRDYEAGLVRFLRLDTHEYHPDSRPLTKDEMKQHLEYINQPPLPLEDGEANLPDPGDGQQYELVAKTKKGTFKVAAQLFDQPVAAIEYRDLLNEEKVNKGLDIIKDGKNVHIAPNTAGKVAIVVQSVSTT
jgi:hypothetical protein